MNSRIQCEPFRATRLWNEIIRSFKAGVPTSRHRRSMKTHDDCFVCAEAVTWLHNHLQDNPNFGPSVTRNQTVQLLKKFQKSQIIEDVRGAKYNAVEFADSYRLFRLIRNSPSPTKTHRAPLTNRTNTFSPETLTSKPPINRKSYSPASKSSILYDHSNTSHYVSVLSKPSTNQTPFPVTNSSQLTKTWTSHDLINMWTTVVSLRLCGILGLSSLSDVIDTRLVNCQYIMHNCSYINKNGVVTNIDQKDQLPHWVLSAMRCLAHWPQKLDDHYPTYPGFEKDVFRVVKDYFWSLPEPLIPYNLYHAITNIFVTAENFYWTNTMKDEDISENVLSPSSPSVENLILNLTLNATFNENDQLNPDIAEDLNQSYGLNSNIDSLENPGIGRHNGKTSCVNSSSSIANPNSEGKFASSSKGNLFSLNHRTLIFSEGSNVSPLYLDNYASAKLALQQQSNTLYKTDDNQKIDRNYGISVALVKTHATPDLNKMSRDNSVKGRPIHTKSEIAYRDTDHTHVNDRNCQITDPTLHGSKMYGSSPCLSTRRGQKSLADHTDYKYSMNNQSNHQLHDLKTRSRSKSCHNVYEERSSVINQKLQEALQLGLLLLPPASRRKLHLLLRLMYKMCGNTVLKLGSSSSLRTLVLEAFYRRILSERSLGESCDPLAFRLVSFLVDNYAEVFCVPEYVKSKVLEEQANVTKQMKAELFESSCCERVSESEYNRNKINLSQTELSQLLDNILTSSNLSDKQKRQKLRQFQKSHPEVYRSKFTNQPSVNALLPKKASSFSEKFKKIKNIRL